VRMFGGMARALGLGESYDGHQWVRDLWCGYKQDMDDLHQRPCRT
jgi:hypothetical protein